MTMALSNSDGFLYFARQQILSKLAKVCWGEINWTRVVKLPAILLLSMAISSLLIVGHTHYTEAQTERLIAHPDEFVFPQPQAAVTREAGH